MSKFFYTGDTDNYKQFLNSSDYLVAYAQDFNLDEVKEYIGSLPFFSRKREAIVLHADLLSKSDFDKLLDIPVPKHSNLYVFYKDKITNALSKRLTNCGFDIFSAGAVVTKKKTTQVFNVVDAILSSNQSKLFIYKSFVDSDEFDPQALIAILHSTLMKLLLFAYGRDEAAINLYKSKNWGIINKNKSLALSLGKHRLVSLHKEFINTHNETLRYPQNAKLYLEVFVSKSIGLLAG